MQNIQQFASGEVRIYRMAGGQQILIAHVRAPGDPSEENHVGKTMDEMNTVAPFVEIAGPENEPARG